MTEWQLTLAFVLACIVGMFVIAYLIAWATRSNGGDVDDYEDNL